MIWTLFHSSLPQFGWYRKVTHVPSRTLLVAVPHVLHASFYTISSSNTVLFGENILLKLNVMFVSMGWHGFDLP